LSKGKEILIRIRNNKNAPQAKAKNIDQILRDIKTISLSDKEKITAIKRLFSGDIALYIVSLKAKIQIKRNSN